jgi:SWI/SNF-related matrix-associated actin-dependent regulator 1 of chromatin subfamily A
VVSGKDFRKADIVIINYDILRQNQDAIMAAGFASIIGDEFHRIKNQKSQRGKALVSIANGIELRVGLSGTPIVNAPKDLVNQLKAIGRLNEFGGEWGFYKDFCDLRKEFYGYTYDGATNLDELDRRMRGGGMYVRREKSAVQKDLPDKTIERVDVQVHTMPGYMLAISETKRMMSSDMSAFDRERHLMTMRLRLQRITAMGKLPFVKEAVDDLIYNGEKVVIFAFFRQVISEIASWYPSMTATLTGSDSMEEKWRKNQSFLNDPSCRIIVCSTEITEGIDLVSAATSIHAELVWTYAKLEQNMDRLHRIGQRHPVTAIIPVANTSSDRAMWKAIQRKASYSLSENDMMRQIFMEENLETIK